MIRGTEMNKENIKVGLIGAACGAVALAIVGFAWGGWVTAGTAETMTSRAVSEARIAALLPHCLAQAQTDERATEIIAELKAARAPARRAVIENAGWATPIGAEAPSRELAEACQRILASA